MIFLMAKLGRYGLALCLLSLPVIGFAEQDRDAALAALTALAGKSETAEAVLAVKAGASASVLTQALGTLEIHFAEKPKDTVAKMFYGYGNLFLAADFMAKKNYMRAAELAKLGFFYIDEAAETEPENWRIRFLRARMDAFVPASNGRCVIAIKDTEFLLNNPDVDAELKPLITLMQGRAQVTCDQDTAAQTTWKQLEQQGDQDNPLLGMKKGPAPDWSAAELNAVMLPMLGEKS